MKNQQGIAHLMLIIVVLLVAGAVIAVATGLVKVPFKTPFGPKQPKVELKTEYKNPFDKKTQFVNPFDTYKNPFVVNR